MRIHKQFFKSIAFIGLFAGLTANGIAQDTSSIVDPETKAPTILSTSPTGGEMNVELSSSIKITFDSDMNEKSINGSTLMLHASYTDTMHNDHSEVMLDDQIRDRSVIQESKTSKQYTTGTVSGTISYSDRTAVFMPDNKLEEGTLYTFTVTSGVENLENIALESDQKWSFTSTGTTTSSVAEKQINSAKYAMIETGESSMYAPPTNRYDMSETKIKMIDLGEAGNYVILAKREVNNESGSSIIGLVGEGSAAHNNKKDKVTMESTTGENYGMESGESDTASADVNEALKDMMSAYAATSMQFGSDSTNQNNKSFTDAAMSAGIHEWSDSLYIASDVTLSGSAEDVWIFKTSKDLTINENTVITLTDGALAENVFWYVEGEVVIGKNAEIEGTILSVKDITLEEGAKLNGRMFSQTSITLDDNMVTEPRKMTGPTSSTNK